MMSQCLDDTLRLMSDVKVPRKPRMSEQETRERLLALAGQRLLDGGVGIGLDAIRMERLIAEAGVSRASAYRCWPHRDDFLADVLVRTIRETSLIPEGAEDITRMRVLLDAAAPHLTDATARRDLFVEALRQSMDADVRRLAASPRWRLFMALPTTVATIEDAELRDLVRGELAGMERAFVERRADIYTGLCQLIGYRQREPWTGREGMLVLSQQAGLAMRGIISRVLVDPDWLDDRTEVALFGSTRPAPWSQAEIAGAGVLLHHLEPDPAIEWTPGRVAEALARFDAMVATLDG